MGNLYIVNSLSSPQQHGGGGRIWAPALRGTVSKSY